MTAHKSTVSVTKTGDGGPKIVYRCGMEVALQGSGMAPSSLARPTAPPWKAATFHNPAECPRESRIAFAGVPRKVV